ncbi:MAG: large subunit ribosomal protein L4 [Microgenomates group bacterium Gr01-1014_80]|nr:MAG: large subunit ribosomal protein L4 [Microgenomates group bacterium Gr01-1014_80]
MPVKKKVTSNPSTPLRASKKQITSEKIITKKQTTTKRMSGLSVPVYSLAGRAAGTLALPKEIFGKEVNKKLLAQALRVYMTNQKNVTASTKTRGEVRGSTAKIQRQKGTGKARHGSIRAPIFVGGGIVFGPKPRQVRLELPQKMRKAALLSALSAKAGDKGIFGVSGLEKATGKTKEMAGLVKKIRGIGEIKGSALIVIAEKADKVVRGVRNIPGVNVMPANQINAYEVLRHQMLLITKEAVEGIREKL